MNDRVSQAIAASADVAALHNAAMASGMKPMAVDGLELAAQGVTSLEEVWRLVPFSAMS